jgi:hypothetical protein
MQLADGRARTPSRQRVLELEKHSKEESKVERRRQGEVKVKGGVADGGA